MHEVNGLPRRGYGYLFPFIATICVLIVSVGLYFSFQYLNTQELEKKREALSISTQESLETYHQQFKEYPKSLEELLLYDPELTPIKNLIINYEYIDSKTLPHVTVRIARDKG